MSEKRNILLIEDELVSQALLTAILHKEGYDVSSATNYDDALKAWKTATFDLIISDYYLEGEKTGADVMRDIRTENTTVPAIALSLAEDSSSLDAINNAGFNFHLKKPVDMKVLTAALTALLKD